MSKVYENLVDAMNNNELEKFFETDPQYAAIDTGMRGEQFCIDYYGMASATNKYIVDNPDKKEMVQTAIMNVLRKSQIGSIIAILEMTAYQLRYKKDLGFLSLEILKELKKQISLNKVHFDSKEIDMYQKLNEQAFNNSGKRFM